MPENTTMQAQTGYAPVNGLNMYHEIHGSGGVPILLLHGAFSMIETDFGRVMPGLAKTRQVIGVEQQAHGHTADIDRPLSYEQMADDTAALLRHLGVAQVDVFGYSFGGGVGFQLATRHPELVRKLVMGGGTAYSFDGCYPELLEGLGKVPAEMLHGTPWHQAYLRVAPIPDDFVTLVAKKNELDRGYTGLSPEQIRALTQPVLLMIGDSDIVRPEHTAEFFRLLGGGVPGDLAGLPKSQLAVLPGTTHVTFVERADWLVSMITAFLDAPMSDAG